MSVKGSNAKGLMEVGLGGGIIQGVNLMKRYLIAGVLVFAFVSPALAKQFYVAFDPASHKCIGDSQGFPSA